MVIVICKQFEEELKDNVLAMFFGRVTFARF